MGFIGVFGRENVVEINGGKLSFMTGGSFLISFPVFCPYLMLEYGFQLLMVGCGDIILVL